MKKTVVAVFTAVALVMLAGSTAYAGQATHASGPISGDQVFKAGTVCDFNYEQSCTGSVIFTVAPSGANLLVLRLNVTHTNLDTGFALTEHDAGLSIVKPGSSVVTIAGIQWHLKSPSGRAILVKAGKFVIDLNTGAVVSFTPNLTASVADALCPALGGNPA